MGGVELDKCFGVHIYEINNFIQSTISLLKCRQRLVYMHIFEPMHYLPFCIIKWFKPIDIIVLIHNHPYGRSKWNNVSTLRKRLTDLYLKGIKYAIFFSPKTMEETIASTSLKREQCKLIHWGEDLDYLHKYIDLSHYDNYWISTGKENRDVETLSQLESICDQFTYVRGGLSLYACQQKVAYSQGIVVIISAKGLSYCTGWTTIVEALAMGKPIICNYNSYWPINIEAEGCGVYVNNNPQEIASTIKHLAENPDLLVKMRANALRVSKQYNMAIYEKELQNIFDDSNRVSS